MSFEPPNGQCYIGAYLEQPQISGVAQAFLDLVKANTNKGMFLLGAFSNLNYLLTSYLDRIRVNQSLVDAGIIDGHEFSIVPIQSKYGSQETDTATIQEIANGVLDALFTNWATQVKGIVKSGTPFFINFGAEFNAWWSGYGNDATVYKNAWKRVHDICVSVGVEADWIIQPMRMSYGDATRPRPNWTSYYAGDAYVDWIGVSCHDFNIWSDAYITKTKTVESAHLIENGLLAFAESHGKPLCFPELGTGANAQSWGMPVALRAQFITDAFAMMKKYDRVKLFNWYALASGTWGWSSGAAYTTLDTPETLNAYKTGVADSRFIDILALPTLQVRSNVNEVELAGVPFTIELVVS